MTAGRKHKMWESPWGYAESAAAVCGVVAIGMLLQLSVGHFDFYLLAYPVNVCVGIIIIGLCAATGLIIGRNSFVRWFSGVPMAVSLIIMLLLSAVIMGFTTQAEDSTSRLGFDSMTRNWAFVLIYLTVLLSLGTLVVIRLTSFKWQDYSFYLNHIGLWLLLAASGLGYADMERYIMHVQEGQTEWKVYDEDKNVKELPVAIQLNDFDMDFYPPKLAVIDRNTGDVMPHGKPQYFQIDQDEPAGMLNGWNVEMHGYIHQAIRNSDSTYKEVPMPGATPAARVTATKNGKALTGWICGGGPAQLYMTLPLDEQYSMVMTTAEARSFTSDIEVYTESGERRGTILEVNKPLRVGAWTIYQYGYDNNMGRLSSYSSFELVYDPWLTPVYIGIIMMMLGAAAMLWQGHNKKEADNDME